MRNKINYLNDFENRVLNQEALGDKPVRIQLIIPTITTPGKQFILKVAVLDDNGCPVKYDGEIRVELQNSNNNIDIKFDINKLSIGFVKGMILNECGFHRFKANFNDQTFYSNPTLCSNDFNQNIYWGDPHIHTVMSDCHPDLARSLNFCYLAGKYLSGLDWVAAADHVSNGRCDFSKWKEEILTCNQYNEPNSFVTIPAYEASLKGGAGGDNNVYFLGSMDMFVDECDEGNVNTLANKLEKKVEELDCFKDFFVAPHHTSRKGKHGEINNNIYPGSERMPVMEIHSKWGTSEYQGNPNSLLKVHEGPSYAVDLLNKGFKLGFIAGTDTHATMTFCSKQMEPSNIPHKAGITAVVSSELTRDNVYKAIKERQCYAAVQERIFLHVTFNDMNTGEVNKLNEITLPLEINIKVAGKSNIEKIEIVRNGKVIKEVTNKKRWFCNCCFIDDDRLDKHLNTTTKKRSFIYYYIRVSFKSGAYAWSSPYWVVK